MLIRTLQSYAAFTSPYLGEYVPEGHIQHDARKYRPAIYRENQEGLGWVAPTKITGKLGLRLPPSPLKRHPGIGEVRQTPPSRVHDISVGWHSRRGAQPDVRGILRAFEPGHWGALERRTADRLHAVIWRWTGQDTQVVWTGKSPILERLHQGSIEVGQ